MTKSNISTQKRPDTPVAVWLGHDLIDGHPVESLTAIFRTTGCCWRGCTMCGYFNDSASDTPAETDLLAQLDTVINKMGPKTAMVKIFTSGSFFDDRELPPEVRKQILEKLASKENVRKIVAETRPEFVREDSLNSAIEILNSHDINLEIAVGLETSSDIIRKDCIHKGFSFNDFKKAAKTAGALSVSTKAYLMLKPPFLSEKMAVEDILASISDTAGYATTISINLCNVQKGTLVEELFNRGDYRPPWLWSAVFILKAGKKTFPHITFMSDPVAAGTKRGPHNCGECDQEVAQSLREFSLTQDPGILSGLDCDCYSLWEKVFELEAYTFGSNLK